jgi:hypothetical protein
MKKGADGYKFTYVAEEAILEKLTLGLRQQGLEIYPMIVPGTGKVTEQLYDKKKTSKDGTPIIETVHETVVSADMIMRWINLENPEEYLDIPWFMVGQQPDCSQSFGSALTYSIRYFYLKFFHVATTEDDPDTFRSKQAKIEDGQAKAIIKAITDEINDLVLEYMGKDKDKEKAAKIKAFLMDNNGDDPDYTKIKDAEIASTLRNKIKEFVRGKKEEE